MKRSLFTLLFLLTIVIAAKAQDDSENHIALSAGPEIGFPSRTQFSFAYGGSLKFEVPVISNFGFSLSGGYSQLVYKGVAFGDMPKPSPVSFIPIKAGVIYYAGPARLEGELGSVLEPQAVNGVKQNLFAYSLGPSFLIPLGDSKNQHINLGVRYESWSKNMLRMVAIRVAYHIDFVKGD